MPKLKTHSGTKKRVRVTKNGKVLHSRTNTNHFLQKKSGARKRRLAIMSKVTGRSAKNIKLKLGK